MKSHINHLLPLLLATLSPSFIKSQECEDSSGKIFIGEPCERKKYWFFTYTECTEYTCEELATPATSQTALGTENFCTDEHYGAFFKRACPGSCGQCNQIVDVAEENSELFSILVSALFVTGLTRPLRADGPFTVFAPTNDAFNNLLNGQELDDILPGEKTRVKLQYLRCILTYHVLAKEVRSGDIVNDATEETLEGSSLTFKTGTNSTISVEGSNEELSVVISPFDVDASNGVIHTIDSVLLPPCITQDIVDLAASASDFSTLVTVITDNFPELLDVLRSGDFTVFAPTNAAFAEIQSTVDDLLENDIDALRDIILYHVVPGAIATSAVIDDGDIYATALENKDVKVDRSFFNDDDITIISETEAKVVAPDLLASNGVIHGIDKVLIPPPCEDSDEGFKGIYTLSCSEANAAWCIFRFVKDACPKSCNQCD